MVWLIRFKVHLFVTPSLFLLIPKSNFSCDVNKVVLVGQMVIWFSLIACLDYFNLWSNFLKVVESDQMIKTIQ